MIIDICREIKNRLSEEYIFVRYMGPKFVIVFSGIETDGVVEFLVDLKKEVENIEIKEQLKDHENEKTQKKKKVQAVNPKLNFVLTTYYKGTALEKALKKLEEYLDMADKNECDINNI